MANTSSAKKKTRQIKHRTEVNNLRRSSMRTIQKRVLEAIAGGDKAKASEALRAAESLTMKVATKGSIHRRTAARKIGRLAQKVNAMA